MTAVPKPPLTPPAATYGLGAALPTVRFRHPAYPRSASDLLVLMATDGEGALDFDIAMVACCIVANMGWDDGYLAQKASAGNDALQQVDRPNDGLLSAGEYLFCIKGQDPFSFKYPVIPSFHHWRFPHGNLPSPWRNLQLPEFPLPRPTVKGPVVAMERDITCRVPGYMDAIEKAHLVPDRERYWFVANEMHRYCRLPQEVAAINDDKNIVILRKDLHHLFDARRFTFIPKRFGSSESTELVTHVLLPSGSAEFIGLYHNRLPQPIRGISVEFLFARFAWCLFRDEHLQFFLSDLEYVVCLWDKARDETHTRTLQGPDVRSIAQVFQPPRSQSRSVSQKRRSLLTQDQDGADDGDGYWSDDGDSTSDEPELNSFDEPPRGRRRKRSWEDLGRGNGHLPSLSSSSATHSSFAGGPVSRPLTPKEGRDTTASPAPASDHIGSERPQKRIHTEGMPGKERRVNDHGTL